MPENHSESVQNYLKHIFELTINGEPASTNALAARLAIAPASVSGMLQHLSKLEPPLIFYQKHQGVTLTDEGKLEALKVIRHHRLIEAWLVKTLGYSWDEVHLEAERLEHVISEEMEIRIADALGNPMRDPHGDLIPTAELIMPEDNSIPLSTLRPEDSGIVVRVQSEDPAFLRHVQKLGIVPGAHLKVMSFSTFDNNTTIQNEKFTAVIGSAVASKVYVNLI